MTTDENKAIVRRFYTAFEANDLNALKDVLAENLVAHNPNPQNREEHLQGISFWNATFSENQFEIVDQVAEGDLVASHVIMHCNHSQASFQGVPPSGKQINSRAHPRADPGWRNCGTQGLQR